MLTKEIIANIAQATGLTKRRANELLNAANAVIIESLMKDQAVPLQSVGTLEIKQRNERTIVHPKTGVRSVIPSKRQISFRPTATLKDQFKNT